MLLLNSMTKHRNIMYEIPFPSQKRWPVISNFFPFLCFQIFQQAKITTSIKKGWLNCCLAGVKED
jgi:hypothetical protein